MAAAEILFTHNNLHSGSSGQEPTLLAGRMGLASNSDAEERDPITERPRTAKGRARFHAVSLPPVIL